MNTRQFTRLYAGTAATLFTIIVIGCLAVPVHLHRATTIQCLNRDWPADKAAATEAWCLDNGYQVGQR